MGRRSRGLALMLPSGALAIRPDWLSAPGLVRRSPWAAPGTTGAGAGPAGHAAGYLRERATPGSLERLGRGPRRMSRRVAQFRPYLENCTVDASIFFLEVCL